jgi:hypothetical protein
VGLALVLTMAAKSFVGDCRAAAKSEEALAETTAHILTLLEDRHGTNWDTVEQTMNAMHGSEWRNQFTPEQWSTLHELRRNPAQHRG